MAYCTEDDIKLALEEAILVELTDDEGTGVIESDRVTRAIADADELIDAYAGMVYSLPFSSTPNLIRKYSVDISIYNLYSRRGDSVPENRKDRFDKAMDFLEKLSEGKVKLDATDPALASGAGVDVTTDRDDRVFSMGRDSDSSTGTLDDY